jgi:ribosomal protein S27AE
MMTQYACPRCGVAELVPGILQSTGTVRFRPSEIKFMTLHTADVALKAHMCVSCGAITLLGDAEKLKLIRSTPEHNTQPAGTSATTY